MAEDFDPDQWLAANSGGTAVAERPAEVPDFDPDKYLADHSSLLPAAPAVENNTQFGVDEMGGMTISNPPAPSEILQRGARGADRAMLAVASGLPGVTGGVLSGLSGTKDDGLTAAQRRVSQAELEAKLRDASEEAARVPASAGVLNPDEMLRREIAGKLAEVKSGAAPSNEGIIAGFLGGAGDQAKEWSRGIATRATELLAQYKVDRTRDNDPLVKITEQVAGIVPIAASGGLFGAAVMGASQAYGETYSAAKEAGASDDEAHQQALAASAKTLPAIPAYALTGGAAGAAERAILPTTAGPVTRAMTHVALNAPANMAASAGLRAAEGGNAGDVGSSITPDIAFSLLGGARNLSAAAHPPAGPRVPDNRLRAPLPPEAMAALDRVQTVPEQPAPVPEPPATIAAQMDQLTNGLRPAVMITPGEKTPPVPEGMRRVRTDNGTYIFDPAKTDAATIRELDAAGRQNEILNLGRESKEDVLAKGQPPVAVTERQPDGTEVRAAAASPEAAAATSREMEQQKTPGNVIATETPEKVLRDRIEAFQDNESPILRISPGEKAPPRAEETLANFALPDGSKIYYDPERTSRAEATSAAGIPEPAPRPTRQPRAVTIPENLTRLGDSRLNALHVVAQKAGDHGAVETLQNEMRRRANAPAQQEFEQHNRKQGYELVEAIVKAGGLRPPEQSEWRGEMASIRESNLKAPGLWRKNGPTMERLVEALREKGFRFETADDLLQALDQRARTGKKSYGYENSPDEQFDAAHSKGRPQESVDLGTREALNRGDERGPTNESEPRPGGPGEYRVGPLPERNLGRVRGENQVRSERDVLEQRATERAGESDAGSSVGRDRERFDEVKALRSGDDQGAPRPPLTDEQRQQYARLRNNFDRLVMPGVRAAAQRIFRGATIHRTGEAEGPYKVRWGDRGSVEMHLHSDPYAEALARHATPEEAHENVMNSINEELRHLSQVSVLHDRFEAAQTGGNFRDFVRSQMHGIAMGIERGLQKMEANGQTYRAEQLRQGIDQAWRLYADGNKESKQENWKNVVEQLASDPMRAVKIVPELERMISEVSKTDTVSEIGFARVLGTLRRWMHDAVARLRVVAKSMQQGELGQRLLDFTNAVDAKARGEETKSDFGKSFEEPPEQFDESHSKAAPSETEPTLFNRPGPTQEELESKKGWIDRAAGKLGDKAIAWVKGSENETAKGVAAAIQNAEPRDMIPALYDAAQDRARNIAEQAYSRLRLDAPDVLDRRAATLIKDAAVSPPELQRQIQQLEQARGDTTNTKLQRNIDHFLPVYRHALENFDRLANSQLIRSHDEMMNAQLGIERRHFIPTGQIENYVTRRYHDNIFSNPDAPVLFGNVGGGKSRYFLKKREWPTLADAIAGGERPELDMAKLASARINTGQRLVQEVRLDREFRKLTSPFDGKPIVTDQYQKGEDQHGRPIFETPEGYAEVQLGENKVLVHQQFEGLMKSLFAENSLRNNVIGRAFMKYAAASKHATLVLDTYHAMRILYKQWSYGGGSPLSWDRLTSGDFVRPLNYRRGLSLLEYSDADLHRAREAGEINGNEEAYARRNRPMLAELQKMGLNLGRNTENLWAELNHGVIDKLSLGGLGKFNRWLFEKLQRGATAQVGLAAYEKNLKMYGREMTREQIARKTAFETNRIFSNLGKQGIFKNATGQALARTIFLAPQWAEGQLRTNIAQAGQVLRTPIDILQGRVRSGVLARGMARGIITMLAVNQIVNLATTGKTTFQNDDPEHKLDAHIPVAGTRGFWFNPTEIADEFTHGIMRNMIYKRNILDSALQWLSNKESLPMRGLTTLATGKDFAGRPFVTEDDKGHKRTDIPTRLKAAALDALPSPLPLQSVLEKNPASPLGYRANQEPGSVVKQVASSLGAKLQREPSAEAKLYADAAPYRDDNVTSFPKSRFSDVKRALDRAIVSGDESEAVQRVRELLDSGADTSQIDKALGLTERHKNKQGNLVPEKINEPKYSKNPGENQAFLDQLDSRQQGQRDEAIRENIRKVRIYQQIKKQLQ